ncbi:hypothetical protein HanIR_Chr12g0566361 [Helianthus annuus]|nr:hypothetical protein HanIR_Chr12g0566361 [Helianthus annuus]
MKFPLQFFSKSSPVPLDCSRLPIPARMGSGVVTPVGANITRCTLLNVSAQIAICTKHVGNGCCICKLETWKTE